MPRKNEFQFNVRLLLSLSIRPTIIGLYQTDSIGVTMLMAAGARRVGPTGAIMPMAAGAWRIGAEVRRDCTNYSSPHRDSLHNNDGL